VPTVDPSTEELPEERTMSGTETFELTPPQAEFYESTFVPALFAPWAPLLVEASGVRSGHRVLDVACGTGIVARAAATRVGGDGAVTGVDRSAAMLAVATRLLPHATFHLGDAGRLPFAEGAFDRVLCQAALMFFPDPATALAEMGRVVVPDGRVGVQVWGRLESSPGFLSFVEVAARHAGHDAFGLLSTYFAHGDLDRLTHLFDRAGLDVTSTTTRLGAMRYDSIDEFVTTEVESTPLAARLDPDTYDRIRVDARQALAPFVGSDGVALPIEGHLVVARKAGR
jgi:SAM-dependent methyltransferase